MTHTADYIGSVVFVNDVTCSMDSALWSIITKTSVAGKLVAATEEKIQTDEDIGYPLAVYFEFEPRVIIDRLRVLWANQSFVSFRCDDRAGRAKLAIKDGISDVRHITGQYVPIRRVRGKVLDLWNGTVNLIVLARSV